MAATVGPPTNSARVLEELAMHAVYERRALQCIWAAELGANLVSCVSSLLQPKTATIAYIAITPMMSLQVKPSAQLRKNSSAMLVIH